MLNRLYAYLTLSLSAAVISGVAACQQSTDLAAALSPLSTSKAEIANTSTVEKTLQRLSAASCPESGKSFPSKQIEIKSTAVSPGEAEVVSAALPEGVSLAGTWSLTSKDPAFGGLSGLDILPTGDLLAISDMGAFVTINLKDNAPATTGAIAYMLGMDDQMLSGKTEGDSEGLTLVGDIAFVSFEREHRILAFDRGLCDAAARGVNVATLPNQIGETKIAPNRSAEALAYVSDEQSLIVFYESRARGKIIKGVVDMSGQTAFSADRTGFDGYAPVGLDIASFADGTQLTANLYRSYDPFRGNRNWLDIAFSQGCCDAKESFQINLKRPLLTDNFEGIAGGQLSNGDYRIWIISDDNFSADQATLLYAFDIAHDTALNIETSTSE